MDKFYTKPHTAKECIAFVYDRYKWESWDLVVEPSAGNGGILHQLPDTNGKTIGLDISPEHPNIISQDFLTFVPDDNLSKRVLTIGNPPFGRVSSMAIQFFNHAAKWSTVIAFIVPRTFRRVSVQNKLNTSFHLVFDHEIPVQPCAFEPPMMAKCCFQIWEKQNTPRIVLIYPSSHPDWTFVKYGPLDEHNQPTPPTKADFAIRAYGGRCGEIRTTDLDQLRPKSWHWISCNIDKDILTQRFSVLDYSQSVDTARQNSIGKRDLVHLYQEMIENTLNNELTSM